MSGDERQSAATSHDATRGAPAGGEPSERTTSPDAAPPPFREPPAPPTAFGASTVGGAVAASALAGPDRTELEDPRSDTTVADGDGMVDEGRAEFPE
jgi:hypothetical protein